MTPSELHLAMTSGFATIAGSVLTAYINLGVPAVNLVTSSIMSIPASIAISKLRYPELNEVGYVRFSFSSLNIPLASDTWTSRCGAWQGQGSRS
jgi:nucleoside permease NupC